MASRTIGRNTAQPEANPASVALWISITVEADYRNRGAFPGLRMDSAEKRNGTNLIFHVPVDFARAVLEDAQARRDEIAKGRGLYQAYRALAKRLQWALDDAEGVEDDPGREDWEAAVRAVGCHPVGAQVKDSEGDSLVVCRSYAVVTVWDEDHGKFRSEKTGDRFSYRMGYVCKKPGSEETFFMPAGDLYDQEGEITHLRLVHSV
jgi:hypothetical protein